jgi:outer membrane protein OmpA-like peptidoglycan-associated protein
MTRLVGPVVIIILMLLAGAAWSIFGPLRLPEFIRGPTTETPRPTAKTPAAEAEPGTAGKSNQAESAPAEKLPGKFDVARIDPDGTSVFAGRTAPHATVTVLGDGRAVGTTQADEHGEWTMAVDHKFASNDPELAIVAKRPSQSKSPPEKQSEVAGLAPKQDVPARAESDQGTPAADSGSRSSLRARQTAKTVTSNLLKNLEEMVGTARTTAHQQPAMEPEAPAQTSDVAPVTIAAIDTSPTASPARSSPTVAAAPSPGQQVPNTSAAPPVRKTIPVPITFVYNESTLTEDGRKAAALLLEYLRIKKFPKVSLTGHADERGSNELNMALSRERLATVKRFLRDSGFEGELELVPKGESEPFAGVERGEYGREDLYQLDRRVELIITR